MSVAEQLAPPDVSAQELASAEELSLPFIPERLEPGESYTIDSSVSLYDPLDVEATLGMKASVPALIEAGDKRLMLVDVRSFPAYTKEGDRQISLKDGQAIRARADFLLIDANEWNPQGEHIKGYKGVRLGEPLIFGRHPDHGITQRFDFSSDLVSRHHFRLTAGYDGAIDIQDLNSKNGTVLTTSHHSIVDDRTAEAIGRVKASPRYAPPDFTKPGPYGFWDGDPIIGRRSEKISGGVYLGGTAREAITVKPDEDPRIEAVYQAMTKNNVFRRLGLKALGGRSGDKTFADNLQLVHDTVQKVMRYDGDAVTELASRYRGDQQVSLGDYIEQGIGVCRHQGLLAAYLLERLIDEGKLQGWAKMERNTIPEYGGTHAWATYKAPNGEEYVVDPAQSFVGTKKEARKRASWDYYLSLA